jgi:hypothetical protein
MQSKPQGLVLPEGLGKFNKDTFAFYFTFITRNTQIHCGRNIELALNG